MECSPEHLHIFRHQNKTRDRKRPRWCAKFRRFACQGEQGTSFAPYPATNRILVAAQKSSLSGLQADRRRKFDYGSWYSTSCYSVCPSKSKLLQTKTLPFSRAQEDGDRTFRSQGPTDLIPFPFFATWARGLRTCRCRPNGIDPCVWFQTSASLWLLWTGSS